MFVCISFCVGMCDRVRGSNAQLHSQRPCARPWRKDAHQTHSHPMRLAADSQRSVSVMSVQFVLLFVVVMDICGIIAHNVCGEQLCPVHTVIIISPKSAQNPN